MSEIILSGVVTAVLQQQQGVSRRTQQPWVSQEYVLCHEQGQYPRSVCFKVFGLEKVQQMAIRQGEYLTVHLNIDSHESTTKPGTWFNSIDCWKVERQTQQQGVAMQPQYQGQAPVQGGYPQQGAQVQQPQQPQYPPQQPVQAQVPFPPQQPAAPFPPAQR